MVDDIFSIQISQVKKDIYNGIIQCNVRGLMHSSKFLAELNHGLDMSQLGTNVTSFSEHFIEFDGIADTEQDDYFLAKSYYDIREYDRAAYFTRSCESKVPTFLHLYSTYMSKEKKRLDNLTDNTNLNESGDLKDLANLLATLKSLYNQRAMDGYMLYLYGVVLKKFDLNNMAVKVLVESIHAAPTLWSSYIELAPLITDRQKLNNLNLPNHWMKHLFIGHTLIELFLNDECLKIFDDLQIAGFKKCVYIISQMAIAYHNKRSTIK